MEATNDNPNIAAKFSSKKVNIRLDFWVMFTDADDNIQYKKRNTLSLVKVWIQKLLYRPTYC